MSPVASGEVMVYFDYTQNRHVCSKPSFIPRLRAYRANWRLFHKATGTWPLLSIGAFIFRYVIVIIALVTFLKYTTARHGLKGVFFHRFAILIFVASAWFLLERVSWSHDLRHKKIAPNSDIWSDHPGTS
jgi:hypothetical protein